MITPGNRCPNLNHGCTNAPVGFCPLCGEVVNRDIPVRRCKEEEHAKKRREGNKYCVNCGELLIQER